MSDLRIAVVGAGIAGLSTAAALIRTGQRCTVFERADGPVESGAGLQLAPNATRLLHRLGLTGSLAGTALRPRLRELRRWRDNTVLGRVNLGVAAEARYGAPYYVLRRAEAHAALLHAVAGPGRAGVVRFGQRCDGVVATEDNATVLLGDGTTYQADVVIGADGMNSVVRSVVGADPPRFTGHCVYRAVLPATRAPAWAREPRILVWLGPGQHCVCYPVAGGRAVNLVATVPAESAPVAPAAGGADRLAAAYAGWNEDVRALVAAVNGAVGNGLFEQPPLPRWSRGRVVLVGDAAHPILPFVAQGAAQAIEDAVRLAADLRGSVGPDVPARLRGYEAGRRLRVTRVQSAARTAARDYHLPDGDRQRRRDRAIATADLAAHDWLYRHAADAPAIAGQPGVIGQW